LTLDQRIPGGVDPFGIQTDIAWCVRLASGMLPGYVAGYYSYEECHVDLAKLASFARARLIVATATGVDTQASLQVPECDTS
jgi:hypothetical protein